jgi:ethanolamine phosphate phosphodiesterase
MRFKYVILLTILFTFTFNEYLIYWLVINQCNWPKLTTNTDTRVMLLADTHLLGSINGHWFDKLRREWQQYRAYQTALSLLSPQLVVILGDLTDEGKWCSDEEWTYYVNRANNLFETNENKTRLFVLVGNHDIGFHYNLNKNKIERFNRSFTKQFVQLETINSLNFVFLNSMTLENDNCNFCKKTQTQLKLLEKRLNKEINSKPIVFTHFPLYRESDDICPEDIDSEPKELRSNFKQDYDCLSKQSTKQLINMLKPRLVFSGHTHFSCFNVLNGVPEYTIPSFSWRNIKTPSMLLVGYKISAKKKD